MLDGVVFTNTPETRLIAFFFLATGFLICAMLASTLPIMWFSLQSSACVFAYLFYFRRYSKSLSLAWRFMTFIAISGLLSFIATMMVMMAIKYQDPVLAKVAFLFAFLGYGFLGAMAPMHFWVAEAHHESLPSVGVMLSCGLTLCGLLALLRFLQALFALGIGEWMKSFCIYAGLFQCFVAHCNCCSKSLI